MPCAKEVLLSGASSRASRYWFRIKVAPPLAGTSTKATAEPKRTLASEYQTTGPIPEYRSNDGSNRYPKNIPAGLAIPAWAFMLPTSFNGVFDVTAAGGINAPDALPSNLSQTEPSGTSLNPLTSSILIPFSGTSVSTVASGAQPTPATDGPIPSRPRNNGAIIGAAVGGSVIVIAMVVGLILWFRSRRSACAPFRSRLLSRPYPSNP